jgi:hypothetical protein
MAVDRLISRTGRRLSSASAQKTSPCCIVNQVIIPRLGGDHQGRHCFGKA